MFRKLYSTLMNQEHSQDYYDFKKPFQNYEFTSNEIITTEFADTVGFNNR